MICLQAVESSEKPMFSSPADIFIQRQSTTTDTVKKEGEEEEEGEEVGRGVRWDPNLVSYSQEKEDQERGGGGIRQRQPPGTKSTAHGAKTPVIHCMLYDGLIHVMYNYVIMYTMYSVIVLASYNYVHYCTANRQYHVTPPTYINHYTHAIYM